MFNRFNFQKKLLLPSVIETSSNEIISVPNTEKILLETKRPVIKKKPAKKRRGRKKKLKLPMVINESSHEIIMIPNTEKILIETKRPYIPKVVYGIETKELLSDLNADFYEELKGYFILELNKEYSRSLRRLLAPSARNLIPYIDRVKRIEYSSFLLKIYDANFSGCSNLINFTFVSVDKDGNYDFRYVFERINGELTIKINYS